MRHFYLYIILQLNIILGIFSVCSAQVIEGDIGLTTQAEVNSFSGTSITGDLFISGVDIVDLATLSTLTSIGGNLNIYSNTELTNLNGLNNLDSVGSDLNLDMNSILTNIEGLHSITFIGGKLRILQQNILTNLDGLSNLTIIGQSLHIETNRALINIDGLSNLSSIGDRMIILNNRTLTNIDGLMNLISIGGLLSIDLNRAVTNLDGLINLTSVGGNLYVVDNDSLISFCGLFTLLNSNGLSGNYDVNSNLVNPTQQEIINGGSCVTSISPEYKRNPFHYKLEQNYPNPFNPKTIIPFNVKEFTFVKLKIYNISGQLVSTLVDKRMQKGKYEVLFNASEIASGIYFYHIQIGNYQAIKKMILVR